MPLHLIRELTVDFQRKQLRNWINKSPKIFKVLYNISVIGVRAETTLWRQAECVTDNSKRSEKQGGYCTQPLQLLFFYIT